MTDLTVLAVKRLLKRGMSWKCDGCEELRRQSVTVLPSATVAKTSAADLAARNRSENTQCNEGAAAEEAA